MTFDWSTFVLEIVNFLILVWLLKHFLYKPVLEMVERRRASVEKTLGDAQAAREEARRLQQDYEAREAQWQQELAQRRQALEETLQAERETRMQALTVDMETERERQHNREQREQAAREQVLQAQATGQATRFAARLLERLGGPALQSRILDLLLEDLDTLADDRVQALREAAGKTGQTLVTSATALADAERRRLEQALQARLGHLPTPNYVQSDGLVCGIRIRIGVWELDASLAGELKAFAEPARHD